MTDLEALGGAEPEVARRLARLAELEAVTSSLHHDLRGILSSAMLIGDRLLAHPDPAVVRAGETIIRVVERATKRLAETRPPPPKEGHSAG